MDALSNEELDDLQELEMLYRAIEKLVAAKHYSNLFYATYHCGAQSALASIQALRRRAGLGL